VGQSSAETVREIEDIRGRIERDFQELERRIPQPGIWLKRMVGILVGGGAALIVLRAVLRRRSGKAAVKNGDWVLVRASELPSLKGVKKVKVKT
jgi:hypothetical protein